MARKKVMTSIYLDQNQAHALRVLANRTDIPMSVWIRRGIDIVIQAQIANGVLIKGLDDLARAE